MTQECEHFTAVFFNDETPKICDCSQASRDSSVPRNNVLASSLLYLRQFAGNLGSSFLLSTQIREYEQVMDVR